MTELRIRNFRNLGVQEFSFPPEGAAIIGGNAQGKSNLLEALYYLETFRSFRGAPDDQLVAFDQPHFRIEGQIEGDRRESVRVAAAFQTEGKQKRVQLDGGTHERLGDALGRVGAVIFSPGDVELVSGGPQERRRFLDIVLSLNDPGYLPNLQEYRKALSRRNASLRAGRPQAEVTAWDVALLRSGAEVMHRRASWIGRSARDFSERYSAVSGGREAILRYEPDVRIGGGAWNGSVETLPSLDDISAEFEDRLVVTADRGRRLGYTPVGPHRDEFAMELVSTTQGESLDLRRYGSGGERRTAALALRLMEARTIVDRQEERPLILLDDAFAELDEMRSERVLDLLEAEGGGQVILTAPKESDVRMRGEALPRWHIEGGVVTTP